MERILYFDCFSGISGDMTLGALLDLGIDPDILKSELSKLHLEGYHLHAEKTQRQAISGTDVDVRLHDHPHRHMHEDDHGHGHNHDHEHEDDHGHQHPHAHEHARNLYDITQIIQESQISPRAKELAVSIFTEIAKAEGKVHGKPLEQVHFHEVGAVDSIVDIVGTAICLDILNVDRVFCSPIQEGRGFVECQHGLLPVPVPAVAEMLAGSSLSLITGNISGELVTPTGFGIIKTVASSCGSMPAMKVEKVGYGFGKKDTGSLNALRVFLGTVQDEEHRDSSLGQPECSVTVLEASIDDETGEILGYTMELLLESGALDVSFTPVYMKKNRPGVKLSVLCRHGDLDTMTKIILEQTSTIGLRYYKAERVVLSRCIQEVATPFGPVRVKISEDSTSGVCKAKPEYEDCARIAREQNLPLREVYRQVISSTALQPW